MAGRSLRAQLNQIRSWVRQGRTDAWIAHQLDVPGSELRDFRRRHGLSADGEPEAPEDLRDEIEAEIEAATLAAAEEEDEEEEDEEEDSDDVEDSDEGEDSDDNQGSDEGESPEESERSGNGDAATARPRRRRRGGRGRGRARSAIQASFDHGERDGYGIWLEPSVTDDTNYSEHWAGHRAVEVTIEPDQIVIRRADN